MSANLLDPQFLNIRGWSRNSPNIVEREHIYYIHTVDENIIATIKMRNNFCYHLKMQILLP